MNIQEALLAEHSKKQAVKITEYIGDDAKRFDELMQSFLSDEYRLAQRASWVLGHVLERQPQLIKKYAKKLWKNLQQPVHAAVKRNTLRSFENQKIPKRLQGLAATLCFDFLMDPKEAIAVRAYAMSICYNIGLEEPELLNELKIIIEEIMPHASAGIKSRGRRILKQIAAQSS